MAEPHRCLDRHYLLLLLSHLGALQRYACTQCPDGVGGNVQPDEQKDPLFRKSRQKSQWQPGPGLRIDGRDPTEGEGGEAEDL